MKLENMISVELTGKLKECGMFKEEIFTVEKMQSADRLYLDISTNGQAISYITKDRLDRFDGNVWDTELRRKFAIQTKPGRVIQAINGSELPYSDQRKLRFMLFDLSDYEVQVIRGVDIAKYYNEDNYEEKRGDLGASCMRYVPSSFFEIYRRHCSMAVVMKKSTGKICARSVIFEGCKSATGYPDKTLLGKIYSIDDIFFDMIKNWAIEREYWIFEGGYSSTQFIVGHDEYITISDYKPYFPMEYDLPSDVYFYPYLDNFEYAVVYEHEGEEHYALSPYYTYNPSGGYISRWSLHDTEGGDIDRASDYCESCHFICGDCWKEKHGGWYSVGYRDDDDWDYDNDDSDWD
ncbi:MAG: hypothetical protein ACRCX2_12305 [Paraclostridium sp.]